MDQAKTGAFLRAARLRAGMTQQALARRLLVSDKAVSKWERGRGCPDVSLLPRLADLLGVDTNAILAGDREEKGMGNGDMRKLRFHVCPVCANLIVAAEEAQACCCGQRLTPLTPRAPKGDERLNVLELDGELYVTSPHAMTKEHHISFLALVTGDTLLLRRLYPEWNLETRLPLVRSGTLVWYCTQDGLFAQAL